MFPKLVINTNKFRHNLRYLLDESHKFGISVMGVTKVFCSDPKLVQIMIEEGVDFIADSRIQNLKTISSYIPKVLLRLPMISEAEDVVRFSSMSLNSEIDTIRALDHFAGELDTVHKVILMIDLGDLREGIFDFEDVLTTVSKILKLKHIKLEGIGTNLTCYGGVIPSIENMNNLVKIKRDIENEFEIDLPILSGGNSSIIELLKSGKLPMSVNNVRLGESIVLGRETAYGDFLDNMYNDVFTLEAELIEIKEKPSIPIGEIGMNAFGKVPIFIDQGNMLRGIIAIGQQDVDYNELIPFDTVKMLGSSSDHIIVDLGDTLNIYDVGDKLSFRLTYASILSLSTSKYVYKEYK